MTEWRNVREANSKVRLARLDEKRRNEEKESSPPPPPPLPDNTKLMNAPVPETMILTPQPLSPPPNDLHDCVTNNGLDFADFDNDTSSPFDNMELKTINDMEELAQVIGMSYRDNFLLNYIHKDLIILFQVLQPTSHWVQSSKLENILNDLSVNGQTKIHMEERKDNAKGEPNDKEEVDEREDVKHRSVSAIVQDLQRDLNRPFIEVTIVSIKMERLCISYIYSKVSLIIHIFMCKRM